MGKPSSKDDEKLKNKINLMMNYNLPRGYIIHEQVEGKRYLLCKIINVYETEQEALDDLTNLLINTRSEYELLKKYYKDGIPC